MKKFSKLAALSCTLLISACFTVKENINRSNVYRTDYVVGNIYKTVVPLFVQKTGKSKMLVSPGDSDARVPKSVESYLRDGRSKWPEIVGILQTGTLMRVARVVREYDGEMGSIFFVMAEILDGDFRGNEVNLRPISLDHYQENPVIRVPYCNRALLEEVK